jgi:FKBP-type peptidyl-prolyl cis-trans isomerase FkpA
MKHLLFSILIISIVACSNNSPYPGFSKGKHGIYFRLHKIGESNIKAKYTDYVTADIEYRTFKDSLFFKGRRKLQLLKTDVEGSIENCFTMLSEGESADFIISADLFFNRTLQTALPVFIPPGSMMKIRLDIIEIQTEQEYEKEKEAFLQWIEDFGDYEKVILQQFLKEEKLPVKPTESGLYYLKLREGTGKKVEKGDTVTVNYEGRFLNGKFFDSTIKRNQPFQFVYGTEWQVVKGLEEAIGMMRAGEKSLFIIPSELAFGTEGSSTGIIPPFTSTIFEVEIISVK